MTVGLISLAQTPALYEGLVAGRARMFTTTDTAIKQIMGRYGLTATENLSSVRLVFHNFVLGNHDTGVGGTCTVTASIEFPAGTFTQVLFGGLASGSIPDGGLLFSDTLTVSIPSTSTFWVRQFIQNATGTNYCNWQSSVFGDAANTGVSGITDQTMSGTISNTNVNVCVPPLAVLGFTTNPSVVMVGDSIGFGSGGGGDINNHAGKAGLVTPSLGAIPFLNLSSPGLTAQSWISNFPSRQLMIPKASHLIQQLGVNDLTNGRTLPQIVADIQAIYFLARSKQKVFQTTITPHSTSTDSWATTGNQTALNQAVRASLNQAIRAGMSGLTGFYDTASILETAQDSDIWIASPSPPYTGDGLHPNVAGYTLVQTSNVVSGITWP